MLTTVTSPHAPPPSGPYSPELACGGLVVVLGPGPFNASDERVGANPARTILRVDQSESDVEIDAIVAIPATTGGTP